MQALELPKNTELEKNIIGSILLDKRILPLVINYLNEDIFYDYKHQIIFRVIKEMYDKNIQIDLTTVYQRVVDIKLKEDVSAYYLSQLTESVVSTAHVNTHIEIIIELYKRRMLINLGKEMQIGGMDGATESEDFMSLFSKKLIQLQEFGNIYEKMMDDIILSLNLSRDTAQNGKLLGINTGFNELNNTLCGWVKPDFVVLAARPGMGKCLGLGTKVIMFDGTIKHVEKLEVGDKLMGVDSKPRMIMSLARGKENMYWVKQKNGYDYRVNESHILSLKRSRNGINIFNGDVLNIPVNKYINKSNKFKSNYKGYKTGFELNTNYNFGYINPYMMGVWLGDGISAKPGISAMENEIIEAIYSYAKKFNLGVRVEKKNETSVSYHYNKGGNISNVFWDTLKTFNLVNNKHIPDSYLNNDKEHRLELLAGLLDTDGYYDKNFNYFEITQKNIELGKQIAYLSRTLGFRVSENMRKATSQNGTTIDVLKVIITGDLTSIPTRVFHKKAHISKPNKNHLCCGIDVEFDKYDDYYGFTLDKDGLFLLEDTTVTHNTAMMLSSIHKLACIDRVPTAIFSLEMSSEQLVERLESISSEIGLKRLRMNIINDDERKILLKTDDILLSSPIYIEDKGGISVTQLRAKATILKQKYGIKIIFIDYLQLMSGTGKSNQNREQEVSYISRSLKALAKELEVPIIALSQLSRRVEERADKMPQLSDLRESGSIEQDADAVIMLMRPAYYEQTEVVEIGGREYSPNDLVICKVEKNRHGSTKNIALRFLPETMTFTDYEI